MCSFLCALVERGEGGFSTPSPHHFTTARQMCQEAKRRKSIFGYSDKFVWPGFLSTLFDITRQKLLLTERQPSANISVGSFPISHPLEPLSYRWRLFFVLGEWNKMFARTCSQMTTQSPGELRGAKLLSFRTAAFWEHAFARTPVFHSSSSQSPLGFPQFPQAFPQYPHFPQFPQGFPQFVPWCCGQCRLQIKRLSEKNIAIQVNPCYNMLTGVNWPRAGPELCMMLRPRCAGRLE